VILASEGYPGSYPKGRAVTIPQTPSNVVIFHAGTVTRDDSVITSGGRVLAVAAYGDTIQAALESAYKTVDSIHFEGKTYRRDIAHQSVLIIFIHFC
jgi:phosphoribosylamine--glycine ligase/phosphoribosylformylglycinamidine cyclo-ligase